MPVASEPDASLPVASVLGASALGVLVLDASALVGSVLDASALVALVPGESVLAAFERGDWKELPEKLSPLAECDPVARFLLRYMTDRAGKPPADFVGVIKLVSK